MQNSLFDDDPPEPARAAKAAAQAAPRKPAKRTVAPVAAPAEHEALAAALPPSLKIGTSSWNYPGWAGFVWDGDYEEAKLSRHGLAAYAQHPLLRSVSLDRAFYKPLDRAQYAAYAAQVPEHFRFTVKAPSLIADALIREEGRGLAENSVFLDPDLAVTQFVEPAVSGLGDRLGALVFQISPLPPFLLERPGELIERIGRMLQALPAVRERLPEAVIAVEFRDPIFVAPEWSRGLVDMLRASRATYCLGLHGKMPPIEMQLPILRALWPGPLVCRWNLHRKHGAYGYEKAKQLYGNFDRIVDADIETRQALSRVASATASAGHPAIITIGNKAEGSAPRSVLALSEAIVERLRQPS